MKQKVAELYKVYDRLKSVKLEAEAITERVENIFFELNQALEEVKEIEKSKAQEALEALRFLVDQIEISELTDALDHNFHLNRAFSEARSLLED